MPCYHPHIAYRTSSGGVVFTELRRNGGGDTLTLPCGQCIGCRLERSRQWAVRCVHEASSHANNCFLTFTYSDAFLPLHSSLVYRDFQLFLKRLRKRCSGVVIRFFVSGEYGEACGNCAESRRDCRCGRFVLALGRPHFHACLFGVDFPDKVYHCRSDAGFALYTSELCSDLWGKGYCLVGGLSFESAAYVARYILKKVTGDKAQGHYGDRAPEFCHMSLKPGIGAAWFARFGGDVFPHDHVVVRGVEMRPPKYYAKLFNKRDSEGMALVSFERERFARSRFADNSDERLAVKEVVQTAAARLLRRDL